jgi:hypothetical protein
VPAGTARVEGLVTRKVHFDREFIVSISSISSITASDPTSAAAQAQLLQEQQQLAIDTANKAADAVIAKDKVAVTNSQRELATSGSTGTALDTDL